MHTQRHAARLIDVPHTRQIDHGTIHVNDIARNAARYQGQRVVKIATALKTGFDAAPETAQAASSAGP